MSLLFSATVFLVIAVTVCVVGRKLVESLKKFRVSTKAMMKKSTFLISLIFSICLVRSAVGYCMAAVVWCTMSVEPTFRVIEESVY